MISFVVPVFNEEESLEQFWQELHRVILELKNTYEVIFVDDGSKDDSLAILKKLASKDNNIKIYSFRRNLGKAEALTQGFIKSKGDFIVTLDADLQDKPSEIHKLLQKAKDGADMVSGWRKNRRDKSKMKIISKFFNKIMGYFFNLDIHDYNCGLKVYRKDAIASLRLYGGLHRFIPILVKEQGFIVEEVVVEHEPRRFGYSKYGFSKLWKDLPDMFSIFFLIKYGKRPLHFFGTVGGVLSLIGVIILIYLSFLRFSGATIGNRPLLFFGMLLVLAGIQIFFTGFLADLIINISHNSKNDHKENIYTLKFEKE